MVDYFRQTRGENENTAEDDDDADVLGESLGAKAGTRNQGALDSVWATNASHFPAAVRPDPDLLVRRILRQFKPEGTTLARVIGNVENYRPLLGGAPIDFITFPSEGYDATSLLANLKVAEDICTALVAPSSSLHAGWSTILPYPASSKRENIAWMLQRFTGTSSSSIASSSIDSLVTILDHGNTDSELAYADYVAPCTTVMIDAQSLFL